MVKYRVLFILIFFSHVLLSQKKTTEFYDIKYPGNNFEKGCSDYFRLLRRLPPDVRYSVQLEGRKILFVFPSKRYFDEIFDSKTDGIAVDIVHKSQYGCNAKNSFAQSWANKGFLMPPMYKADMVKNLELYDYGYVGVEYGELPRNVKSEDVELNLIILQKKYLCGYHPISNLNFHNWDVLETGLYADSLKAEEKSAQYSKISKTLHFTIPFKKNQYKFGEEDIKPLYDSLELTNYNIKEFRIKAYTSIEGSFSHNEKLQNQRSESIVKALQQYQSTEIESHVEAKENWVEFMNDISGTQFEYLGKKSKQEIKDELTSDKGLLNEMERILGIHRKGIVELSLQKKLDPNETNPETLVKFFDQSIADKNIQEAIYLQEIIFENIRENRFPDSFIGRIEVPYATEYGPLLNNRAAFEYERADTYFYDALENYTRLNDLLPNNPKIQYNLTVLKMKAWLEGELITNRDEIKHLINNLEILSIDRSLIKRLRINYYITLSQYLYSEQNYVGKDRSVKQVYSLYKSINLSDSEKVSLSKFLSYYSKFGWAEKLLYSRVNELDASEDLLFYYIQLTISDPKITNSSYYKTLIFNAIEKNNRRFCNMFLPKSQGGYTFQLLEDNKLKKLYCESCTSTGT